MLEGKVYEEGKMNVGLIKEGHCVSHWVILPQSLLLKWSLISADIQ